MTQFTALRTILAFWLLGFTVQAHSQAVPNLFPSSEVACESSFATSLPQQVRGFVESFQKDPWKYRMMFEDGFIEDYLGAGVTAQVFRTNLDGKSYAVKVLDRVRIELPQANQGLPIQIILGANGISVPLRGVLKPEDLERLGLPKDPFKFGVVMDEVQGLSSKRPGEDNSLDKLQLTQGQYDNLLADLDKAQAALVRAEICLDDVDFFIGEDGSFRLIDIQTFHLGMICEDTIILRKKVEFLNEHGVINISDGGRR